MQNREILFLNPVFTHNIWGGKKLREDFGYQIEGNNIGECWGISAHEKGDCTIAGGPYQGMKLSELWQGKPELFGNLPGRKFPLMVKLIDAKEDLSIQVHPNNQYAKMQENGALGKAECWYILDCKENASLIVGHNAKTREELADMVCKGRWKEFIREVPVKKGSFIQIDPGMVHAIKGGVMVYEAEQNSDVTYRVYDYDRMSGGERRKLHVQQSIDVITVPAKPVRRSVLETGHFPINQWNELISCAFYRVWKLVLEGGMEFEQREPFLMISVVEGNGSINGVVVKKGAHMILPDQFGRVKLSGNLELMAAAIGWHGYSQP